MKLKSVLLIPALLAALPVATAAAAQSAPPAKAQEAEIPFATTMGIRTFTPDDDGHGIYLQDQRRTWYHADLAEPCFDLPFAVRVGFQTFGGSSSLSRGDTIVVGHDRCMITSLVRSEAPPARGHKAAKQATQG
jgi:hypothetical protein